MMLHLLLLLARAALATASEPSPPPPPLLLPPCTRALAVRADVPPLCACAVTVVPSVAGDAGHPPSQPLHAVTGVPVVGLAPGHWTLAVACAAPCVVADGESTEFPLTLAPCAPDAAGAGMAALPHVVTVVAEGGKGRWGWVRSAAAVVAVCAAAAQAALSLM